MHEKHQYFNGLKFTRDESKGYYRETKTSKLMHIYVWEFFNGKVPSGYEIHHKDLDRGNNDISNLEALPKHDHRMLHAKLLTEERKEFLRESISKNAIPEAIKWHKSEDGREWHKKHMSKMRENGAFKKTRICSYCGREYIGELTYSKNGYNFCSNKCKSAQRRKDGADNITIICEVCGKPHISNKYDKVRTCSRSCANILKWRKRKNESQEDHKEKEENPGI